MGWSEPAFHLDNVHHHLLVRILPSQIHLPPTLVKLATIVRLAKLERKLFELNLPVLNAVEGEGLTSIQMLDASPRRRQRQSNTTCLPLPAAAFCKCPKILFPSLRVGPCSALSSLRPPRLSSLPRRRRGRHRSPYRCGGARMT